MQYDSLVLKLPFEQSHAALLHEHLKELRTKNLSQKNAARGYSRKILRKGVVCHRNSVPMAKFPAHEHVQDSM